MALQTTKQQPGRITFFLLEAARNSNNREDFASNVILAFLRSRNSHAFEGSYLTPVVDAYRAFAATLILSGLSDERLTRFSLSDVTAAELRGEAVGASLERAQLSSEIQRLQQVEDEYEYELQFGSVDPLRGLPPPEFPPIETYELNVDPPALAAGFPIQSDGGPPLPGVEQPPAVLRRRR